MTTPEQPRGAELTDPYTMAVASLAKLPRVPNFIRTEHGATIDVAEIPERTLRAIGKRWTLELLANRKKRRSSPRPTDETRK